MRSGPGSPGGCSALRPTLCARWPCLPPPSRHCWRGGRSVLPSYKDCMQLRGCCGRLLTHCENITRQITYDSSRAQRDVRHTPCTGLSSSVTSRKFNNRRVLCAASEEVTPRGSIG